ncbi:MAG: hypothetical protein AB1486_07960 [Planctomycetota bacterium]
MAKKHPLEVVGRHDYVRPSGAMSPPGGPPPREAEGPGGGSTREQRTGPRGGGSGRARALGPVFGELSGLSSQARAALAGVAVLLVGGVFCAGYFLGRGTGSAAPRDAGSPALRVSKEWRPAGEREGAATGASGTLPQADSPGGEEPSPGVPEADRAYRVRVEIYEAAKRELAEYWRGLLQSAGMPDAVVLSVPNRATHQPAWRLYVGHEETEEALSDLLRKVREFKDPRTGHPAFGTPGIEFVEILPPDRQGEGSGN